MTKYNIDRCEAKHQHFIFLFISNKSIWYFFGLICVELSHSSDNKWKYREKKIRKNVIMITQRTLMPWDEQRTQHTLNVITDLLLNSCACVHDICAAYEAETRFYTVVLMVCCSVSFRLKLGCPIYKIFWSKKATQSVCCGVSVRALFFPLLLASTD